jgi:hypothetical protein
MLKKAIPWTVEEGFVPDRNVEARPLSARSGQSTRTGGESHTHRKPVRRRAGA